MDCNLRNDRLRPTDVILYVEHTQKTRDLLLSTAFKAPRWVFAEKRQDSIIRFLRLLMHMIIKVTSETNGGKRKKKGIPIRVGVDHSR